jgi:hypothetical protein
MVAGTLERGAQERPHIDVIIDDQNVARTSPPSSEDVTTCVKAAGGSPRLVSAPVRATART